MNVFDLRGPEFLWFYVRLMFFTSVAAALLRWALRGPGGEMSHLIADLEPCDAAYLAGGPKMVVDTALAAMVHGGPLKLLKSSGRFKINSPLVGDPSPVERVIFELIESGTDSLSSLRAAAGSLTHEIAERLRAGNLALSAGQAAVARVVPAILLVPVLMVGVTKVWVGLSRGRPVEFLLLLCFITTALILLFALKPARRTRAGDRMMSNLRGRNSALRITVGTAPHRLAQEDLALAIALFGPSILVSGDLLNLRQALWPVSSSSDGSSSCGGGGGCGGGGCGGCGG